MDKKVLIIAYYWPPSGGSGVQRWLKFVKYLPSQGVQPHVYTPLNPDFNVKDLGLENEIPKEAIVVKRKIVEPYGFYRALAGKKKSKGANFGMTNSNQKSKFQQFAMWVRGNLFIPDPRVFWVKPSYRFLKQYIKENDIKKVVTTGPPHSMHLIGLKLKKYFKDQLEWTTDFRDPWTKIYYKDELKLSKRALKRNLKLESSVIAHCDKLITVSDFLKAEFEEMGASRKSHVVFNGFDQSDYSDFENVETGKYVISYIGLFPKISNPENFWKALANLVSTNQEFADKLELVLVGNIDPSVKESIENNNLSSYCDYKGIVSHDKAIEYQQQSNLLLLTIPNVPNSEGILTGKFFEYMATQIPIIGFGPSQGDVATIMKETNTGDMIEYTEYDLVEKVINDRFSAFLKGENKLESTLYTSYSREELTKKLHTILFN